MPEPDWVDFVFGFVVSENVDANLVEDSNVVMSSKVAGKLTPSQLYLSSIWLSTVILSLCFVFADW
jgi:hypothetical protein